MSASPDPSGRQRSSRGGEPLRAPVDPGLRSRYASLFADDIERWSLLLEAAPVKGSCCLDLDARAGHGAALLRAGGAHTVWAMVQGGAEGALYGGEAHHLMRGDLAWLRAHPDLQPAQGFDLIVCAALQWVIPADRTAQRSAFKGLYDLLSAQGTLLFGWPSRQPRRQPLMRTTPHGIRIIEQRLDRTHWQCRLKSECAPWIQQGASLSPKQCLQALAREGFSAISQRRLDTRYLCIEATR